MTAACAFVAAWLHSIAGIVDIRDVSCAHFHVGQMTSMQDGCMGCIAPTDYRSIATAASHHGLLG